MRILLLMAALAACLAHLATASRGNGVLPAPRQWDGLTRAKAGEQHTAYGCGCSASSFARTLQALVLVASWGACQLLAHMSSPVCLMHTPPPASLPCSAAGPVLCCLEVQVGAGGALVLRGLPCRAGHNPAVCACDAGGVR